jgi:hypothetical protein
MDPALLKKVITVRPEQLIIRPRPEPPKPPTLTRQQQYQILHRIHWDNLKALNWPEGPIVYGGKRRSHTRKEMRVMARNAARNQLREIRAKEKEDVKAVSRA